METLTRRLEHVDETHALGVQLGQALRPGDFVGLVGDLGAGKTVFCRAVAQGMGIDSQLVTSPTYSLVQHYEMGRVPLQHWDWYRLSGEGDLLTTGYFDLIQQPDALLVEWVNRVPSAVPADWLQLELTAQSPTARLLTVRPNGAASSALLDRWIRVVSSLPGHQLRECDSVSARR